MPREAVGEWISQEWRDPDGYPTLPSELVASTHGRRYSERDFEQRFRAHVLEAYRPRLMLVERKIYELKHLVVYGFRRRGRIIIEVENWRTHESEWFNAMVGIPLEIDTAEPGGVGEQPPTRTQFTITGARFDKKHSVQYNKDGGQTERFVCEANLEIRETLKSTLKRVARPGHLLKLADAVLKMRKAAGV